MTAVIALAALGIVAVLALSVYCFPVVRVRDLRPVLRAHDGPRGLEQPAAVPALAAAARAVPPPRFTPAEAEILAFVPARGVPARPAVPGVVLTDDQDRLVRGVFDVAAAEVTDARPLLLSGDRDGFRARVREIVDHVWENLRASLGEEKADEVRAALTASAHPLE